MATIADPSHREFIFAIVNSINRSHRVVTTNIKRDSIESRVQEAQVVIFLRDQSQYGDHQNGTAILRHIKENDCLILEGDQLPSFLCPSIYTKAHLWDVKPSPELKSLYQEWMTAIQHAISSLHCLANALIINPHPIQSVDSEEEILADDRERCLSSDPLVRSYQIASLRSSLKDSLVKLKEFDSRHDEIMKNEFLVKSIGLVQKIQGSLLKHEKVWVVLSEVRGRHVSVAKEIIDGVSHLYQSLEAAGIHYVTLKHFDPHLKKSAYSHSPKKAEKIDARYQKQLEKEKKIFRNAFEMDFPTTLSVEEQYQAFTTFIDDPSWNSTTLFQAGETLQFFLERALTWE